MKQERRSSNTSKFFTFANGDTNRLIICSPVDYERKAGVY